VKRARLVGRVQDLVATEAKATKRDDLRVVLAGALRMPTPDDLPVPVNDDATDPGVVPGVAARMFRLGDGDAHPRFVIVDHPMKYGLPPDTRDGEKSRAGPLSRSGAG
jgi:hypothetical protein